jgi:CYTH domain-containing protein
MKGIANIQHILSLGLEAATLDGKATVELEYVFFAKLKDLAQLESIATHSELQEQYELRKPNGCIRVRAVDDKQYILTAKAWKDGVDGKAEAEQTTTADMFRIFKLIADSGMRKRRFFVPIPNTDMTWEFDVYYTEQNGTLVPVEWIKIDLEVAQRLETLPEFPVPLESVFDKQPRQRTPEEQAFVSELFDKYFLIKKPT